RTPPPLPAAAARRLPPPHPARPRDALPRGDGHVVAQRRPAARRGLPEPAPMSDATVRSRAWDDLLGRPVSMRSLALLRVFAGPIVLLHLQPFLSDALDGRIYRDAFFEPYAAWYPELPRGVYVALLWLAVVAAISMSA